MEWLRGWGRPAEPLPEPRAAPNPAPPSPAPMPMPPPPMSEMAFCAPPNNFQDLAPTRSPGYADLGFGGAPSAPPAPPVGVGCMAPLQGVRIPSPYDDVDTAGCAPHLRIKCSFWQDGRSMSARRVSLSGRTYVELCDTVEGWLPAGWDPSPFTIVAVTGEDDGENGAATPATPTPTGRQISDADAWDELLSQHPSAAPIVLQVHHTAAAAPHGGVPADVVAAEALCRLHGPEVIEKLCTGEATPCGLGYDGWLSPVGDGSMGRVTDADALLQILMRRGAALLAGGQEEAEEWFRLSALLAPESPDVWYGVASAAMLSGASRRHDDAFNALAHAVAKGLIHPARLLSDPAFAPLLCPDSGYRSALLSLAGSTGEAGREKAEAAAAPAPAAPVGDTSVDDGEYSAQIAALREMGYFVDGVVLEELRRCGGDVEALVG